VADPRYPAGQHGQRRAWHQGSGGVRRQLQGLPTGTRRSRDGSPAEFGTPLRARRQVTVHQGSLGRLDHAKQMHADVPDGSPRTPEPTNRLHWRKKW